MVIICTFIMSFSNILLRYLYRIS